MCSFIIVYNKTRFLSYVTTLVKQFHSRLIFIHLITIHYNSLISLNVRNHHIFQLCEISIVDENEVYLSVCFTSPLG